MKYCGVEIITIDHLVRILNQGDHVWHINANSGRGAPLPAGFVYSWQLRYTLNELKNGKLFEVEHE